MKVLQLDASLLPLWEDFAAKRNLEWDEYSAGWGMVEIALYNQPTNTQLQFANWVRKRILQAPLIPESELTAHNDSHFTTWSKAHG